jgi:cytochrome P450
VNVKDHVVDFDPEGVEAPLAREARLRSLRNSCPVAKSGAHGGFWLISRYDDVSTILNAPDRFSSAKFLDEADGSYHGGTIIPPVPVPRFIPSETDSPEWDRYRGVLNPYFGPRAVEARRAQASRQAHALIDRVIETGHIDLVLDLGNPLSAIVTMDLLGFPLNEWERWAAPFHESVYSPTGSPELAHAAAELEWVYAQIRMEIEKRRVAPTGDLISRLMHDEPQGGALSDHELLELSIQVLGGAIETTTALTSNALFYLHGDHSARTRLIDDRLLLRRSFEEFLRYFAPVQNLARTVMEETAIGGQTLQPGDRILMSFASANRDETIFEDADSVVVDRPANRHLAMGRGKHFCLGSFQARMMFDAMMNAVFDRIPDYAVTEDQARRYPSIGNVNGWVNMPTQFTPGASLGNSITGSLPQAGP